MNDLSGTIATNLSKYYRDFAGRVRELADRLDETQYWAKPYPYGNSFGSLVLHPTGNLEYHIGASIGGSGYVRDREREFTDRGGSKAETLAMLDAAVDRVVATLGEQHDADWAKPFGPDPAQDRFGIYLRCAAHFHHHIGQMIYLVREWTKGS